MKTLFDNIKVNINEESVTIGGSWEGGQDKPWSSDLVKLCYNLLPAIEECVLLDIGANTGTFSLLPVCIPNLKVHSFEPNPDVFNLLNENIKLNNIQDRVTTHKIALSDKESDLIFKVPINGESGFGCLGIPKRFTNFKTFEVRTHKLDDMSFEQIDIIKIDTEGCEIFVLKGAENTIKKHYPLLLVEYQPKNTAQFNYNVLEIDKLLNSWGYEGVMVSEEDKLYRKYI